MIMRTIRYMYIFLFSDEEHPSPELYVTRSAAHIARRSTCPYMTIHTLDPDRVPARIREVRCLCRHCQHSGRGHAVHTCRPVKYYTRVWRRVCRPGTHKYDFIQTTESVTVGCVCVRERVVPFRQNYHPPQ